MSNEPKLIVTPQQYHEGYQVFHGLDIIPNGTVHSFEFIRKLEDGNYVVRNPKLEVSQPKKGAPDVRENTAGVPREPPASQQASTGEPKKGKKE